MLGVVDQDGHRCAADESSAQQFLHRRLVVPVHGRQRPGNRFCGRPAGFRATRALLQGHDQSQRHQQRLLAVAGDTVQRVHGHSLCPQSLAGRAQKRTAAHPAFTAHEDQTRTTGAAQKAVDLFRLALAAEQASVGAVHAGGPTPADQFVDFRPHSHHPVPETCPDG